MLRAVQRFFRTPKGLLLLLFAPLLLVAVPAEGVRRVGPSLVAAAAVAMLVDAPILRARDGRWTFPSGALLTALIVAMVLSPTAPWYVAAVASAIGVVAKYMARTRSANVFNPAALGIVVTYYAFGAGQSWWGALGGLPPVAVVLLFGTGIFIADRVNKMPMVLVFLGAYYLMLTAAAFVGDPSRVVEVFRPPDSQAALFFAFFILTDPPTSPVRYRDQMICALIVAVSSVLVFERLGAAHYLLSGVLVGNLWEARRRARPAR